MMLQLAICHLPSYFGTDPDRETILRHAALLPEKFRTRLLERRHIPSLLQSLGGMLLLHERMRPQGYVGCLLIFTGIVLSQLNFQKKHK